MSNPASLSEFQQSLATRVRDAATAPASGAVLGLRSGSVNWLLRLEDGGEIMAVPDIATVPLTRPWYLGLANVRGNLVSVIDLALLAEGRATPRSAECRVVLVAERYRVQAGLLVQRLLGLKDPKKLTRRDVAATEASGVEATALVSPPWAGPVFDDENGDTWTELDVAALVRDDVLLRAGL